MSKPDASDASIGPHNLDVEVIVVEPWMGVTDTTIRPVTGEAKKRLAELRRKYGALDQPPAATPEDKERTEPGPDEKSKPA